MRGVSTRRSKATLRRLVENPGHGRVFESQRVALDGVRTWVVRGFPFLVYYREVADGIEVIHILHGARDQVLFWRPSRTSGRAVIDHRSTTRSSSGPRIRCPTPPRCCRRCCSSPCR
ncbi:MAG: type II toxin-antitoxin system RelE/ParE family toxin [Planctomycetes bacterium]|nr:type II toxin-antitoxin system RelE/ParE family toxin [Planctomycetota bacterium]